MYDLAIIGASGFLGMRLCEKLSELQLDLKIVAVSRSKIDASLIPGIDVLQVISYEMLPPRFAKKAFILFGPARLLEPLNLSYYEMVRYLFSCVFSSVIYASSGSVYDSSSHDIKTEGSNISINTPYSRYKYRVEKIAASYDVSILRLSNVYGRGMNKGTLISDIEVQLRDSGLSFVRLRSQSAVRDFIHINDLINLFIRILDRGLLPGIYNVGSEMGFSVSDVFQIISGILDIDKPVIYEKKGAEVDSIILNSEKIRGLVGWKTFIQFRDSVQEDFLARC